MNYLTTENITFVLTMLLVAERIVRAIAPITKTDLDDRAIREIDKAKEWGRSVAPAIYAIVEGLAASGKIPKAEKAKEFISEISEAYTRANGSTMPVQAIADAQTVARGLAAATKNPPAASSL